jgi:chemotaxis family two-component system sensor kinase Cph1
LNQPAAKIMPDAQSPPAAPPARVLDAALSIISDSIIATNKQGRVTFVNPAAERLTGWTLSEARGVPLADVCSVVNSATREPMNLDGKTSAPLAGPCNLLSKDGGEVSVEVHTSPIQDAHGSRTGCVIVIRDLTELNRTEKELANSAAELKKSRQDLEQFARGAAHDLESPLKAVLQLTQLLELKYGEQLGDDARQYIAFIAGSVNRMDDLIKRLLHYFEASSAETQNAEPVALDAIVASSIHNLRARICETDAVVTHDPLPTLDINPILLSRLFQNVIDNAIHYHGEEPPRVHVSAVRENESWLFAVTDNGVGIAPEYHERIFEPFKRLHGPEWPGSGLGLAICSKILERLGGRIWLKSDVGKGSIFYFTIPPVAASRQFQVPEPASM